jgi:hypothetical protein
MYSYVRQKEIHTAGPLVPNPSPFEVEMATAKLKKYKLPGIEQVMAKLTWNKEELPDQ